MEPLEIVEFRPDQAKALVRMWRESFELGVGVADPHPLEEQERYLDTVVVPNNAIRVALTGGEIAGFVAASPDSVAQLYVAKRFLRRGIGSRLLDWAKAQSRGSLWLYTFERNTGARTFYERHGFRIVARGFEPHWKLDDLRYEWKRNDMRIEIDDLSRPAIHALLNEHLRDMHALSPPESVHALDLGKLRSPGITFWSAWDGSRLLGCGALKELDPKHGEVKSMRTPAALRRRGAGRAILAHIIEAARSRSYERLSLETGSMEAFRPARKLYESAGFTYCGPFGEYTDDPNSVFMTLRL